MFRREKAEQIAIKFFATMNPNMWSGKGKMPESFDTRIMTFNINSINGNELDISMEYLTPEESEVNGWTHYCELRDRFTGELVDCLHGYGIDSMLNLTDTIMDICATEN